MLKLKYISIYLFSSFSLVMILDNSLFLKLLEKQKPKLDLTKSLNICIETPDINDCMEKLNKLF
jgi:hypothetical protein